MRLLEERGILERRDFGGGRARYEPTEHGHHHHLIDIDTGRVIEFSDAEHERVLSAIAARLGFELVSHRLELFGRRIARRRTGRARRGSGARARPIEPRRDDGLPHSAWRHGDGQAASANCAAATSASASPPRRRKSTPRRRCATGCSTTRAAPGPMPPPPPSRRDRDAFDAVADHLAGGRPRARPGAESVVATYRLIRASAAAQDRPVLFGRRVRHLGGGSTFPAEVMELGRSCVDPDYRNRAAMQLLWRGIAAYVFLHRIDLMFGCASLPGTDPDAVAVELTYLYHHHLAPPALRPRALPHRYVEMRRLDPAGIDPRRALAQLPPLIKGYLRLGGFIGDGAVIDEQFNTIDVAVVVKTDLVTDKYYRHYERQARDANE